MAKRMAGALVLKLLIQQLPGVTICTAKSDIAELVAELHYFVFAGGWVWLRLHRFRDHTGRDAGISLANSGVALCVLAFADSGPRG